MTLNTHPEILARLTFNLEWWPDADVRTAFKYEYLLDEFVFEDENVQHAYLQHKANMISDYFNKLYETTQYEYNPLNNVDADETETRTITGSRTHTRTPDLTTANDNVTETIENGDETTTNYDSPVESGDFKTTTKSVLTHEPSTTTRAGAVKLTGTETEVESYQGYTDELHKIRKGNIGVTMTQQLIQAERDIILNLKQKYLEQFVDYFMITM